jgi:predicted O-linked N-acetylglucosamine transferase (SPINDLY family)
MATTKATEATAAPAPAAGRDDLIREALAGLEAQLHDDAILACEKLLRQNPLCPEAIYLLGLVAYDLDEPLQGIKLIEKAHQLSPNVQEFADALAAIQARIGLIHDSLFHAKIATMLPPHPTVRGLLPDRFGSFFRNLEIGRATLYRDRAQREMDKGAFKKAVANCERQLELTPGDMESLRLLAQNAARCGRTERAIAAFHAVLHSEARQIGDLSGLARALAAGGRHGDGLACHSAAIDEAPDDPALHSHLLADLLRAPEATAHDLAEAHGEWQRRHAAGVARTAPPAALDSDPERPLRVGYLSAAFHESDLMELFEPVLKAHRQNQVKSFCYATGLRLDHVTESLMHYADKWTDINGIDDETLCEILRGDRIDILVDLDGHRDGGRPLFLARHPAPVTVGWLGYAHAPGIAALDHVLTDGTAWPERLPAPATGEGLWRLERAAFAWQAPGLTPEPGPLPAARAGHATFGASCDLALIGPSTAALWGRVLGAVEGARLLLCNRLDLDQAAIDRCLEHFANMGLRDRVDIVNMADNFASPFEFYRHVDLALDPGLEPGTGGVILENARALWMGVPLLVLAGAHHARRLGATLLAAAGHPEWSAESPAELAAIAAGLAADPDRLAALRGGLRDELAAAPISDIAGFTRDLEAAYRAMWRAYLAKLG